MKSSCPKVASTMEKLVSRFTSFKLVVCGSPENLKLGRFLKHELPYKLRKDPYLEHINPKWDKEWTPIYWKKDPKLTTDLPSQHLHAYKVQQLQ